jgi:ubiquinone/menaquinone biosynthesis C-methylase UbiE
MRLVNASATSGEGRGVSSFRGGVSAPPRTRAEMPSARSDPVRVLPVLQTKEETRAFYNRISRVYDLLSDRSEAPMRRAGLELLKPRSGERILEIGFGTGHTLVAIATAVGREGKVLGLDLSDEMVRIAAANLSSSGLLERAQLGRGDAVGLPYESASLDGTFMCFTLELFDTPEIPKVLGECKRVLRRGGRLVVVAMSKGRQHDALVGVFEWAHVHFPNLLDCRPIHVRQSVAAAGFKVRRTLTKRMWVPVEIVLGVKP